MIMPYFRPEDFILSRSRLLSCDSGTVCSARTKRLPIAACCCPKLPGRRPCPFETLKFAHGRAAEQKCLQNALVDQRHTFSRHTLIVYLIVPCQRRAMELLLQRVIENGQPIGRYF